MAAFVRLSLAARILATQLPQNFLSQLSLGEMFNTDAVSESRASVNALLLQGKDNPMVDSLALDQLLTPGFPAPRRHTFGFPVSTGQKFLALETILFAKAEDNVVRLYLTDGEELLITKPLAWLEGQLEAEGFSRIHHSYVINFHHLQEYIRNDGGYVVLSNQKAISISRRRKEAFLAALEAWNRH